jgi:thiol-disulfide isomerase/thioredoxin
MNKADAIQKIMEDHLNRVKNSSGNTVDQIENMRVIKGDAILDFFKYATLLKDQEAKGIYATKQERISLSYADDLLSLISSHIRSATKTMNHGVEPKFTNESQSNFTNGSQSNMLYKTWGKDETEELSVRCPTTEAKIELPQSNTKPQSKDSFQWKPSRPLYFNPFSGPSHSNPFSSESRPPQRGGVMTEMIGNMETTDLSELFEMAGGCNYAVDKPTIINYWADWCPYSTKFEPEWRKFESEAKTKYPHLQVLDLNVGQDRDLSALAHKSGVDGYPTIVLYANGKMTHLIAGNKTQKDIMQFIEQNLNKK